ncbi:unnamed protein product [Dibothriocephalus latus]|uniref:Uncharacterized protein n=1 Tax=Dibothriocephalus latus TaxID=60516 RepID=A0A3P7LLS8_DIBLA|nr:unnamed protein product [Dibothriocephalus latus]
MPQSLRSKNTTAWLHKPRLTPEAPRTHDELTAKLASLAERTTADEDKEVDHCELVAMMRAIAASDSALWLAAPSMHLKTDDTPREGRWLAPASQTKTSDAVSEVPTEDLDEEADVEEEEEEEEPGNPEYFTAATRKAKLAHILSEEMSPEAMLELIPAYPHRHSALSRWLKPKSEAP